MTTDTDTSYVPGVCNINRAEIAYRRKAEYIGLISAALLFVGLLFTPIHPVVRAVLVFIPLFVGVIGYFQVKNRFCVSYGASGKQNATPGSTSAAAVNNAVSKATDKRKARSMNIKAALISLVIVALSAVVPRF